MKPSLSLREYRFRKRITQFGLRCKTGIHQTKISLAENGYITFSENEKARIAAALGVHASEIDWDNGRLL